MTSLGFGIQNKFDGVALRTEDGTIVVSGCVADIGVQMGEAFARSGIAFEAMRRDGALRAGEGVVEHQADLNDEGAALGWLVEPAQEFERCVEQP